MAKDIYHAIFSRSRRQGSVIYAKKHKSIKAIVEEGAMKICINTGKMALRLLASL